MTWIGLYSHNVALLQFQIVHIVVIALASVLELNLHEVSILSIARHVGQPVVGVQLSVLTPTSLMTESTVAAIADAIF
jgi:hypothetical protein